MENKGVDLTGLQTDISSKTFHWSGYYEHDMNQAITRETCLNAFENFNPILPDSYRNISHILLGNIHPELQLEVLNQIKNPEMILCDTMNFWIETAPEALEKVFAKVDIICINDGEACQFCGTNSLPRAAKQLSKLGAKYIVIKKGSHGVLFFENGNFFSVPGLPLMEVKDPTGAGDSFAGATIGYLARSRLISNDAFRNALVAGTVLASYCVEDFSCNKTNNLTQADILNRVNLLQEYTRIPEFVL